MPPNKKQLTYFSLLFLLKYSVEPKSLFPSSPEYHVRQSRKPMLRSPSPEPVNKPRTPAKSKSSTPAKATRSVTRSARKVKATPEPIAVLPTPLESVEPIAETIVEPEVKNDIATEVVPTASRATLSTPFPPFNTKSAFTLMGVAAVGITAALFGNSYAATPAAPVWSDSISLKGDSIVYMTQGDVYNEQGVSFAPEFQKAILDGNPSPSISFEYSQPSVAFSDFVSEVGSFDVEYQVASPWFGEVKLTRQVIVSDVNECTYSGNNDLFKHNCSPSQSCTNSVGSFSCV